MADEDKAKAEKLAAAKKRFEQLKKEQAKKGKKAGTKKQDEKSAESGTKVEDAAESHATAEPSERAAVEEEKQEDESAVDGQESARPLPERQPSLSQQSKQRSESFRQGAVGVLSPVSTDPASGTGPINAGMEVQELYKKQTARIEELEKENDAFKEQQTEGAARLAKAEEELESLREGSSDMAELRSKAKEADRLSVELAAAQRQLAQAQQAAKSNNRRISGAGPDLTQELASKTSTIESLEMALSVLRHQMNGLQASMSERDVSVKEIEERAKAAETATASYRQELDQLKVAMAFPSEETQAANEDPEQLTKRITVLESDLRTANSNLEAAEHRAKSLEQKVEALTKLHRDATTANVTKEKELADLRQQLKRRDRPSHVREVGEFELGDDETETGALHARIRGLEAENFDLRRGVWRDKRAEMQPGMNDYMGAGGSPEYEDVDLNAGPYSPRLRGPNGSIPRQSSTFQDVITSGISAFTGRPREPPARAAHAASPQQRNRAPSLGLLSDEGGFDEEAFRLAQEEEGKRRVERVKEVKRGLDKWKGWRVDLVELRQQGQVGGREVGPVFEV
ncbi:hypothetical protein BAUCODRAFT_573461 [Baudoinia panamericana UAMH 10762]|uniref:M protein repeat protein n=1 Tax=Baudoinia panamericana (strain UAMH 10762) TaxID=717646 RepID=M2LWW9_BAUPA|nr:uncharacterized protein BAUCODRAFT_573461 [Baudoinia panamericana UAMH 10762]EMC99177.1 hypothetical protein BAUCODRAFT_573461 [Baudoinia panamericana UAMH 10762]